MMTDRRHDRFDGLVLPSPRPVRRMPPESATYDTREVPRITRDAFEYVLDMGRDATALLVKAWVIDTRIGPSDDITIVLEGGVLKRIAPIESRRILRPYFKLDRDGHILDIE